MLAGLSVLVAGGIALAVFQPWEGMGGPEPWEYDAENDRYWHAGHGHWHEGEPPPPGARY